MRVRIPSQVGLIFKYKKVCLVDAWPKDNFTKPKTPFINQTGNNFKLRDMKYRKKPVVVEAVQWTGKNFYEVMKFTKNDGGHKKAYEDYEEECLKTGEFHIRTLEGLMTASPSDFIIKGVKGEFYPCKPDIFDATYEKID